MSYVPPPPPPPETPAPSAGGRPGDLWWGILAGLAACLGLPALSLFASGLFGGVSLLGLTAPLICFVTGIVLVFVDRTRRWGIGLLIGFFVSLIIGAGACVVLLTAISVGG